MMIKNYRLTPWDTKSLKINTAELINLDSFEDINSFSVFLDDVEKELKIKNIDFVYTRINSQNKIEKKILQEKGYYFSECSVELYKSNIQKFEPIKCPKIDFLPYEDSFKEKIQLISRNSFRYSRFHEDPNISTDLAKDRFYNWISDVIEQGKDVKLALKGDMVIGFLVQELNQNKKNANMILAGCDIGKEIFAKSLWNEILAYNKSIGVSRVDTVVSAANLGVMNLYNFFNFKVNKTSFGFHKFIKK